MTQRRSVEVPWILFSFLFHFLLGHTGLPLFFADHTQANGSKPKGTKFSKTYKKHAGQGGRQNFHCVPAEGTWKSSGSPEGPATTGCIQEAAKGRDGLDHQCWLWTATISTKKDQTLCQGPGSTCKTAVLTRTSMCWAEASFFSSPKVTYYPAPKTKIPFW